MPKKAEFTYHRLENNIPWEAQTPRDKTTAWLKKVCQPHIAKWDREGRFPTELIPEMAKKLQLFGVKTDPQYGGHGGNNWMYGALCDALEWCDSGLRSFFSVQNSLGMGSIERFGTEEQKKLWLPGMVKGEMIVAFGLTGPQWGSNPESTKTFAKKDGGDFVIRGKNHYITNGNLAHGVISWAHYEGALRGFFVPRDGRGFTSYSMGEKDAMRASDTAALEFDDVRIPAENLLPGTMEKRGAYHDCLGDARFGISWGVIGSMRFCAERALAWLEGRGLTDKQLIQYDLASINTSIMSAQLMAHQLTRDKEEGSVSNADISTGKLLNVDLACDVARLARRLMGGDGIMAEFGVMRHMRNLEAVYTYEGTTGHIHPLLIGRAITGKSAF